MLDSNRSERTNALNQQIGHLLGVLLACLIVGFFAYLEGKQSEARENRSFEYAQAAKANAIAGCQRVVLAAVADCVYDEMKSADEKAHNEQDLEAQQWMARWAFIMTIIAAGTALLSWIALRYLRDTFQETARMAQSERAWIVPQKNQVHDIRESTVDGIPVDHGLGFGFQFSNRGRSPALSVSVVREFAVVPTTTPFQDIVFKFGEVDQEKSGIVGPGGEVGAAIVVLTDEQTELFRRGSLKVVITLRACYSDIFCGNDGQRLTEVSYELIHAGGTTVGPDGVQREAINFNMIGGGVVR